MTYFPSKDCDLSSGMDSCGLSRNGEETSICIGLVYLVFFFLSVYVAFAWYYKSHTKTRAYEIYTTVH